MKNFIKKAALSCLVLLTVMLSPALFATKAYAGEVLTTSSASEPKLNVTELSLVTDDNFTLKVFNMAETQKASFKSSDTDVAGVDKTGKVTANKVGEATITVTLNDRKSKDDLTFKCKVTVGPPAISVKITLSNLTLEVGKRKTLQVILKPNTTTEQAVFSSTNPEVATVSATGKVVAKSPGKTYIIAEIANGKYDVCTVTVIETATGPAVSVARK